MRVLGEFFDTVAITEGELLERRSAIDGATIIVLFRTGLDDQIYDIVGQARANGGIVVYDVDDLVFDPAIATPEFIDGIRALPEEALPGYYESVKRARRLIGLVDACTLSTRYLAERIAALGKPALLLHNGIDPAMLSWFDRARASAARPADGKLRIGFAAGTRTHQRDFACVKDALLALLRNRDNILLTVIGALDLAEYPELAEVAHKIEQRPLVPHEDLPLELARLDINLAPLELGNPYCEAKSELKYFDAAMLEIPTVASPTDAYAAAIRPGHNGYLATSTEEWRGCIEHQIDHRALRIRIGKQARVEALRRFGPGTLRENTKRVYQQLLAMRREATPCRALGYDNFLYAINYQPGPQLPVTTRGPRRDRRLVLHWIVPRFAAGAGGMSNILRVIQHLEVSRHRNTIWVHSPWDASEAWKQGASSHYKNLIERRFRHVAAEVHPLPDDLDCIAGDAVIATDHYSAYPARAVRHVRKRFYFLQDHEPEFNPSGFAALFAEATYGFGFDALCNGAWLKELATRHGMWSMQWEQAADPQHYYPTSQPRQERHIAFYARRETPRRAVELGLLAFELLTRWGVEFHVDFFGGDGGQYKMPYPNTNYGVLPAAQLGDLYRSATVGMVFSATNYSIIPREMMACGLPVLEIASASACRSFSEAAAVLSEPTPEAVARHLRTLLLDRKRREQVATRGRDHAARFSWEKSATDIEVAIVSRLEAAAAQPDDLSAMNLFPMTFPP
jgi:glycosyltransferase involved in cell wall biosynthesis